MSSTLQFPWQQEAVIRQSQRLLHSFQHWTGRSLLDVNGSPEEIAQQLFEVPFPVFSHGTESDPIYNYANRKGLELWEVDWQQLTRMPSRYSAEPMEQEERLRLLDQVTTQGYVSSGVVKPLSSPRADSSNPTKYMGINIGGSLTHCLHLLQDKRNSYYLKVHLND